MFRGRAQGSPPEARTEAAVPGQGQALPLPYTGLVDRFEYGRGGRRDPCGRPGVWRGPLVNANGGVAYHHTSMTYSAQRERTKRT